MRPCAGACASASPRAAPAGCLRRRVTRSLHTRLPYSPLPPPPLPSFFLVQPEWSVHGGTIHFGAGGEGRLLPASSSKRGEVDPHQLIANALAYAVEIERIV